MSRPNKGPRLEQNSGGFYEIRWTENGRSKRVSTRATSLQEAQRFFAGWLTESDTAASEAGTLTVKQILKFYLNTHVEEQVIAQERAILAARNIELDMGDLTPRELTAERIAKYKRRRRSGELNGRAVTDGTIRRELVTLVAALNHARRHRKIQDTPAISLPPIPPPRDLWMDESEEQAFWIIAESTNGDRLSREFRFVAIALETAARLNSVVGLRWEQVDLDAQIIRFDKDGKRQKNKRRVAVPISDRLLPVLKRAFAERTGDFVLDNDTDIRRAFNRIVSQAASTIDKRLAAVTPHTLRHTWATLAARAGVDLYEIAGVLGDTLATVERNYLHHCPNHLRGAINFKTAAARNVGVKPESGVWRTHQQPPTNANRD